MINILLLSVLYGLTKTTNSEVLMSHRRFVFLYRKNDVHFPFVLSNIRLGGDKGGNFDVLTGVF